MQTGNKNKHRTAVSPLDLPTDRKSATLPAGLGARWRRQSPSRRGDGPTEIPGQEGGGRRRRRALPEPVHLDLDLAEPTPAAPAPPEDQVDSLDPARGEDPSLRGRMPRRSLRGLHGTPG